MVHILFISSCLFNLYTNRNVKMTIYGLMGENVLELLLNEQ